MPSTIRATLVNPLWAASLTSQFRLAKPIQAERRKPNIHVSVNVAATDTDKNYTRIYARGDQHYVKLIIDYSEKFGQANHIEIDKLRLG